MRNAEFRPRIICAILDAEKLSEFSILCSVTKAVVCYLLNKRVATFTIVPYCQQIAEHSAPVILQSKHGGILHSVFRKVFSPVKQWLLLVLERLPKPEPKPRIFGKTEPTRNRGFRRPNGRFGFGGSAYMVLVTVRVFVTGL